MGTSWLSGESPPCEFWAIRATIRIEDHLPSRIRDLSRPQSCLRGQQHDDLVSGWISGALGVDKEVFYVVVR
jgi:hypothetical protein